MKRALNKTHPATAECLDDLIADIEPTPPRPASEVALCVGDEHPVLAGRVRCAFGDGAELWLPCLANVRPRAGDRVLILRPDGAAEGIVTGVVDGYRRRLEPGPRATHSRRLRPDESVVIESDTGQPLIEVRVGEAGPCVRMLTPDVAIEASGALRLEADSIALVARQGAVEVRATDDVKLEGEQIHLN